MATKDLSRTVVGGGRRSVFSKAGRRALRESNREERHRVRSLLRQMVADDERIDAAVIPRRKPVYPDFSCQLRPLKRWLAGRVGQPWDAVFHQICERFDRRTFRGRHIIDLHVLGHMVERYTDPVPNRRWREFRQGYYVDEGGILRYEPRQRRPSARWEKPTASKQMLDAWLAGRKVGRRGSRLLWLVSVERYVWNSAYSYVYQDFLPFRERTVDRWTFRQDRALSRDEVAFYERLTTAQRAAVARQ